MRVFVRAMAISGVAFGVLLPTLQPADAQVFYRQWSYYGDPYQRRPLYVRPMPLPPDEIADILIDSHRYRRISEPRFAGHMYIVDGISRSGSVVRTYVDAFDGRIIDTDVLRPAARHQDGRPATSGPRIARLPDDDDRPRTTPPPPRRPSDVSRPDQRQAPATPRTPPERQAIRSPATAPAAPATAVPQNRSPSASPIVPLSREPRVVNPAEVRVPDEVEKAPPMSRSSRPSAPAASPGAGAPPATTPPALAPSTTAPALQPQPPAVPRAAAPAPAPARTAPAPSTAPSAAPAVPPAAGSRQPSTPPVPTVPAAPLL